MKVFILLSTFIISSVFMQVNADDIFDTTEIAKATASYGEARSASREDRVKLFKGYADVYFKKSARYKSLYKQAETENRKKLYKALSTINRSLGNEKANMAVAFERNDNKLLKQANTTYLILKEKQTQVLAELHEEEIHELKQTIVQLQLKLEK